MPVATVAKVQALAVDFRSQAALADMLGVSRSRVTRWLKGAGIDPLNAERVDLLELVWSNLLCIYAPRGCARVALGRESEPRRSAADRRRPSRARRGVDAGDPRRARGLVCVILHRCFAWSERARPGRPDSPLWFPRVFQGDGRHDNPDAYGCLYLTDLDDPAVLRRRRLRPSLVATRRRPVTQPQALVAYRETDSAGLCWWSIFESLWANYTIFDRARPLLRLQDVRALSIEDAAVAEAAEYLGLGPSPA